MFEMLARDTKTHSLPLDKVGVIQGIE